MGLFKSMRDAMGQTPGSDAGGRGSVGQQVADRDSLQGQTYAFNRILKVGTPARVLIRGHVDTGEQVAGNAVWVFDLEITPDGGPAYTVQHRQIVSTMAMTAYPDGASMGCRVDPADPQKIAFGEPPSM